MTDQVDTNHVATSLDMPKALAEAITQVMSKVGKLAKEEKNQHGGYNFASVDAFLEAVQPACAEAGLFIMQDEEDFEIRDGWLVLRYRFTLGHKSGVVWAHQPRRTIMVNAKQGSQAFGSAQSYALKQFMRSLFQIATGDKEDADNHPQSDLPAGQRQQQPAKTYGGTAKRGAQPQAQPAQQPASDPIRVIDADGEEQTFKRTKRGALDAMQFIEDEIDRVQQIEDQATLWTHNRATFQKLADTPGVAELRKAEGAQTLAERVKTNDQAFREYLEAA